MDIVLVDLVGGRTMIVLSFGVLVVFWLSPLSLEEEFLLYDGLAVAMVSRDALQETYVKALVCPPGSYAHRSLDNLQAAFPKLGKSDNVHGNDIFPMLPYKYDLSHVTDLLLLYDHCITSELNPTPRGDPRADTYPPPLVVPHPREDGPQPPLRDRTTTVHAHLQSQKLHHKKVLPSRS